MEEFYHHGIRGQKWGVRRYQNKDGSLTPAGRKRANKLEEQYKKITGKNLKKQVNKKDAKKSNQSEPEKPKTFKEMTNDELKNKTDRINLEKNYMEAQVNYKVAMSKLNPKKVSLGRKFISATWSNVLQPTLIDYGKNALKNALSGRDDQPKQIKQPKKFTQPEQSKQKQSKLGDLISKTKTINKSDVMKGQKLIEKQPKHTYHYIYENNSKNKSKVNDLISKTKTVNDSDVMKGQMSIDDWLKNMK